MEQPRNANDVSNLIRDRSIEENQDTSMPLASGTKETALILTSLCNVHNSDDERPVGAAPVSTGDRRRQRRSEWDTLTLDELRTKFNKPILKVAGAMLGGRRL